MTAAKRLMAVGGNAAVLDKNMETEGEEKKVCGDQTIWTLNARHATRMVVNIVFLNVETGVKFR